MQPLPPPTDPYLWLSPSDLVENIADVPDTFEVYRHLDGFIKSVVRGWLTELIGEDLVNTIVPITDEGEVNPHQAYLDLIKPFLAFAVWSLYIQHGNVIVTDTGPVTKLSDGFEPISNQQRTELGRFYKGEADRYALKIARLVAKNQTNCSAGYRSGRPTIRSAGGKRTSRFN